MTEGIQGKEATTQPERNQVGDSQSIVQRPTEEQFESNPPIKKSPEQASKKGRLSQSVQRSLSMVAGLVLLLGLSLWGRYSIQPSDPYIQNVLQLSGDVSRGNDIFQLNCATCHGLEAAGEVGPTLQGISERRSQVALIQQVISGQTPPMPQFQPNERDMADLLSFLETL